MSRGFRLAPAISSVAHHVTPFDPVDITTSRGSPASPPNGRLPNSGRWFADASPFAGPSPAPDAKASTSPDTRHGGAIAPTRPAWHGRAVAPPRRHALGGPAPGDVVRGAPAPLPRRPGASAEMAFQHSHPRPPGRIVARADIAFPSVNLGLEAHSRRFHFGPDAEALDEDRDIAAALCGWELAYLGRTRDAATGLGAAHRQGTDRPAVRRRSATGARGSL